MRACRHVRLPPPATRPRPPASSPSLYAPLRHLASPSPCQARSTSASSPPPSSSSSSSSSSRTRSKGARFLHRSRSTVVSGVRPSRHGVVPAAVPAAAAGVAAGSGARDGPAPGGDRAELQVGGPAARQGGAGDGRRLGHRPRRLPLLRQGGRDGGVHVRARAGGPRRRRHPRRAALHRVRDRRRRAHVRARRPRVRVRLPRRGGEGGGGVRRPHRRGGEQRGGAVREAQPHRRHRGRPGPRLPHQLLLVRVRVEARAAEDGRRRLHHQHVVRERVQGQQDAAGLHGHQGCHRGVHARAGAAARREGRPRQRRRAGARVDAAHPGVVRGGEGGAVRRRGAHEARRAAGRGRALLRLPRQRPGLVLHVRPVPPRQRRRHRQWLDSTRRRSPPAGGMHDKVTESCGSKSELSKGMN